MMNAFHKSLNLPKMPYVTEMDAYMISCGSMQCLITFICLFWSHENLNDSLILSGLLYAWIGFNLVYGAMCFDRGAFSTSKYVKMFGYEQLENYAK